MIFNSYSFIFIFLPLALFGWFWLFGLGRDKLAKMYMTLLSFVFYGMFNLQFVPILLFSALVNYGFSAWSAQIANRALVRTMQTGRAEAAEKGEVRQKRLMAFAVIFNLLYLCVFKYGTMLNGVLPKELQILFPVGISFYTFSQISFVVDRCKGDTSHDDFWNYMVTVTFFPKLVEGPITFYDEIADQFADSNRHWFHAENFIRGLCLFTMGMAKKMLLADNLAPIAQFGFESAYYTDTLTAAMGIIAYAFQLYFDFSGYIDMATGIARMFNITLPLNFDSPYQATSFSQFWQKWHMTLTRFLTKYVYIPLGGSRRGVVRRCLNVMIVFTLSGIWHGTGWTYLYWGILSGALVVLFNTFLRGAKHKEQASKPRPRIVELLLRLVNFVLFCFTLVFFGAPSIDYALVILKRFFLPMWPGFLYRMADRLSVPEFYPFEKAVSLFAPELLQVFRLECVLVLLAVCVALVNGKKNAGQIAETAKLDRKNAVLFGILFVWCLASMTGVSTYLYFQY